MLFNDVDPITKFGAWGAQEYGGQVGAPKQVAVDRFLKRPRLSWLTYPPTTAFGRRRVH